MQFTKMHGLENDYIYINTLRERVANPAALSRAVSDRHAGVGSDGLILVGPAEPGAGADVRMRMFNADGSESPMCGNGIRCVARFAIEQGIAQGNPLRIQTGRGTLAVSWTKDGAGHPSMFSVDMGEPILEAGAIPARLDGLAPDARAIGVRPPADWWPAETDSPWRRSCGCADVVSFVSMGNPHAVFWCADADAVPLERVGPLIERHASFPQRVNAHFAQVLRRDRVKVRTWERGSGATRACGTGACAVVVAGVLEGALASPCRVDLPGGTLRIEWPGLGRSVLMSGPAVEVCRGTLAPELAEKAC
jgi:diaminopimelate epimerase